MLTEMTLGVEMVLGQNRWLSPPYTTQGVCMWACGAAGAASKASALLWVLMQGALRTGMQDVGGLAGVVHGALAHANRSTNCDLPKGGLSS